MGYSGQITGIGHFGIVYYDINGKIISMNPAAERILGKAKEEFLGSSSMKKNHHNIKEDLSQFFDYDHPAMISLRTGQIIRNIVMGVFNLSNIAMSIIKKLKSMDKSRVVEIVIEPELFADADEGLIKILLENLIQNAWKFTSKKADARIEFGIQNFNNAPFYFVHDNGAGFDMAYAEKLVTPFKRMHSEKEYPGTGIGLTIVKRIVEKHGGTINVAAEKDKGATFYFSLASSPTTVP